jgi:hypothetical protein
MLIYGTSKQKKTVLITLITVMIDFLCVWQGVGASSWVPPEMEMHFEKFEMKMLIFWINTSSEAFLIT